MIGKTIGHYKILGLLGAGGMGKVYRAEDTTLKRQIALKILPPDLLDSQQRLRRFRREAEVLAGLNHPNIVVLHSVAEADGIHYLTMELVEGKPLTRILKTGGLPVDTYFKIAVPLAEALSAAHEKGIVHRDLKPDNIMVSNRGIVKVLDFGLAKLSAASTSEGATDVPTESLTADDQVLGTVPYMSPEQVRGEEVNHQSDIFSLGVVLHEMATGKRLFHGTSSLHVASAILTKEPGPISESRSDLPFHLTRIVTHCLVKDRAHRYQSSQDLSDELEGLKKEVESGHLRTRGLSAQRTTTGLFTRRRLGLVAAAVLVLVIAAASYFLTRGAGSRVTGYEAIAVMPFDNFSGDPSQDYLGEGLGAGLITQLSQIRGLSVVGRSETWRLRGKNLSASQIGRRLGVEAVLEGSLSTGEKLRAQVNLTDARTGRLLWSGTFKGSKEDQIQMEQQIAREVTRFLSVPLSMKERRRLASHPSESSSAYDYYQQGQQFLEAVDNPNGAKLARDLFELAINIDSQFALAHAGLSDALWRLYQKDQSQALLDRARQEAETALAIDPDLPAAQVALARVLRSAGRHAESIAQLRRILANHPRPEQAHRELAFSYEAVGDFSSAEESLQLAAESRSVDWHPWNSLAAFYVRTSSYEKARSAFEKAASLAPQGLTWPLENLASVSILEGDPESAIEAFEKIEVELDDPILVANIATAYFYLDRLSEAEPLFELAVKLNPQSPIEYGNLGDLYNQQGRKDEAEHAYRKALFLVEEALLSSPKDNDLRSDQALYSAKSGECKNAIQWAEKHALELPRSAVYVHDRAMVYALCEEPDTAIQGLEEAIELGYPANLILRENEFRDLRTDPGFVALMGEEP